MQSILDVFLEDAEAEKKAEEPQAEEPQVEKPTVEGPRTEGLAPCCRQPYRLHVGALYLYLNDKGVWRAVGDLSHVYRKCREGLVKNLWVLKRIFDHVSKQAEIFGVGKAYGDIFYILMLGKEREITLPAEFQGLSVTIFTYEEGLEKAISDFERFHSEEHIDYNIVEEALRG